MAKKPAKKMIAKKKPAAKAAPKAAPKATPKAKPTAAAMQKARSATKPRNTSTLSYTQSEVIENLRAFCGIEKRSKAKEMAEDIASFLMDALKRGYKVPFLGICKLQVRTSKARTGINPKTGEQIQIPARKRVRFTATKALKQAVL
jgi:DNA-binding protein HU-beta